MHVRTTCPRSGERCVKVKILKPSKTLVLCSLLIAKAKNMKARVHVFVSGRVQGVFFRSETKRKADSYSVKGWVRNLPDDRVEAVFEGEEEAVATLVEFCKRGPSGARVMNVDLTWENYTGEFAAFKIKY
jgi:acylphosphatase